jgi:hypothetical protein
LNVKKIKASRLRKARVAEKEAYQWKESTSSVAIVTYVKDLGKIVGHAGAIKCDEAELLDLGQGPPVHVRRAHVDVRTIDQPKLRVKYATAEKCREVQAAYLHNDTVHLSIYRPRERLSGSP